MLIETAGKSWLQITTKSVVKFVPFFFFFFFFGGGGGVLIRLGRTFSILVKL